jgi:hypothetical protein
VRFRHPIFPGLSMSREPAQANPRGWSLALAGSVS